MKITEFQPIQSPKDYVIARVVVESWFGLKVETREVFRETYSAYWKWLDNGKWVPGVEIDQLEAASKAKAAMKGNSL